MISRDNPENRRRQENPQKLSDEVGWGCLEDGLEANRFGMINAFANAAQKLGPVHGIEMEKLAGKLLKAPLQFFMTRQAKGPGFFL